MNVRIPTPLRSYTGGAAAVSATGATVGDVIDDLDRSFPGIAFRMVDEQRRIRTHINVWLDDERVRDLDTSTDGADELTIMQALSGGAC